MNDNQLTNANLVRSWLWWGLIWITIFPVVGLLISVKFHNPEFLGTASWFTFGRLRPIHVNGVIFGSFSTPFFGLLYYFVPRLCGTKMFKENLGWIALWIWNIFLFAGSISFAFGHNLGFEAAEFEWPLNILRFSAISIIAVQFFGTVLNKKEPRFYVSLWYVSAAFVWTGFNLVLGNIILPYANIMGINSAAVHGLYIHYVVGLWITPAGLAIIYYFLPVSTKNPLHSHKLSLLGFWTLAFFYPFVGTHHYLLSPIPHFTQTISIVTSMLLIIPVWSVTVNFFGTAAGKWKEFVGGKEGDHFSAKFLMLAAVYYLLGCFQGSTEALRRLQELTHFNDFVISHSHFTVFGAMVLWAVGGMYYTWPRVTGRTLWSARLSVWHFRLTFFGATLMFTGLITQGFIQGSMLEHSVNFVDTLNVMKPWWVLRTVAGATMDVGLLLMLVNFYYSCKKGKPIEKPQKTKTRPEYPLKLTGRISWIEKPSGVMILGGVCFFFLAVFVQGGVPILSSSTKAKTVKNIVTQQSIQVTDYSPLEAKGRKIYIREGCWYCHSQYIRPMSDEKFRWGPVPQIGEYAFDRPHLLGTRRIGPDLTRVGRKYSDDWHAAHYWNPANVVPDTIMPRFPWLFDKKDEGPPSLNKEGKALVAYVQKLGTSIGDWREGFLSTQVRSGLAFDITPQEKDNIITLGKTVYKRRCTGCHGEKGDGKGPSAAFLNPKPRDFTTGIFKFRSTLGENSLPTDEDLFLTITHGLSGTAMPPWFNIPPQERIAVVAYIKTFSQRWKEEKPGERVVVPPEPRITLSSIIKGKTLLIDNCSPCHGWKGLGDGGVGELIVDYWGEPLLPANFTLPAGVSRGVKLGHGAKRLFVTIRAGVGGTPMPGFHEVLNDEETWQTIHFLQFLYVRAQVDSLSYRGLVFRKEAGVLSKIWSVISEAARRGDIEEGPIQEALKKTLPYDGESEE